MKFSKSPIRYAGGKGKKIDNFKHLFPFDKTTKIIDCFTGGGSVALYLSQDNYQVQMNDLDFNLYNFWHKLKTNGTEMVEILKNVWNKSNIKKTASGIELYNRMKIQIKSDYEIDRAVAYYTLNRIVFAGMTEIATFSPTAWEKKYFDIKKINKLLHISKILQNIEITNVDYREIFAKDHTSFYFLDPPYDIKDKIYKNHAEFDHIEFVKELLKIDNKFILTYNCGSDIIKQIKGKYTVLEQKYNYCLNYKKSDKGELSRSIKNEWLITNTV